MNEHLNYCKVCKHRQVTFEKGICCELTNDHPFFKDQCDHYEFDQKEFNELCSAQQRSYLKIIDDELPFQERQARIRFTEMSKHFEHISFLGDAYNIKVLPSKSINTILGIGGMIAAHLLFRDNHFDNFNSFSFGIIIVFIVVAILCFNKVFFPRPILILKPSGIEYKNKLTKWEHIICTSFQTEKKTKENQNPEVNFVIDKLIGKEIIPVGSWNMKEEELGHYIELCKEKFKSMG